MRHRALRWSVGLLAGLIVAIAVTTQSNRVLDGRGGPVMAQSTPNQPPTVVVRTPNGGEVVELGKTFNITWSADDPQGQNTIFKFDIQLSTDGGIGFPLTIAQNVSGAATSFNWQANLGFTSFNAKVRIIVHDNNAATSQDDSDGTFSIIDNGVPVTLISPNGGETVSFGQTANISWSVPVLSAGRVGGYDLFYSTDGGVNFPFSIAGGLSPGTSSFLWQVPPLCATQVRVLVVATTVTGARTADEGDGDAQIVNPGPTLDLSRMLLDPDTERMQLLSAPPGTSSQIPFLEGCLIELSTDEIGSAFVTFEKPTLIKKQGRKALSRGLIDGVQLSEFFPLGATRILRVTNPACGVTQVTVRRFGFQYFAQQ